MSTKKKKKKTSHLTTQRETTRAAMHTERPQERPNLIQDFQLPELWENKLLLCKSLSPWYFAWQHWLINRAKTEATTTTPPKATFQSHKDSLLSHGPGRANHKTSLDSREGGSASQGDSSQHTLLPAEESSHTTACRGRTGSEVKSLSSLTESPVTEGPDGKLGDVPLSGKAFLHNVFQRTV